MINVTALANKTMLVFDLCEDAPQSNNTCSGSCGAAGTWYAFPELGRCPPGKPLGYNKCKWLDQYQVLKTITLDCLRNVSVNAFACYSKTVVDLQNELLNAFNVCQDVQFTVTKDVDIDVHESVMPALGHVVRPKSGVKIVSEQQQPAIVAVAQPSSTASHSAVVVPRAPPQ